MPLLMSDSSQKTSKIDQLSPKRQRFVREYVVDHEGAKAAIRAGYAPKCAADQASQLLSNSQVAAAVAELDAEIARELGVSAKKVLHELDCMAHYDPADLVRQPLAGPADIANLPENVRRAIIGWSWDKMGNFVIKLSPKTPSLDLIGKHLKIWNEVGSKENPIHTVSDADLDARLAALEAKER